MEHISAEWNSSVEFGVFFKALSSIFLLNGAKVSSLVYFFEALSSILLSPTSPEA